DLCDFLTAILRIFAEANRSGMVRSAPFQMKTGTHLPGREPDVLFISQKNLKRLKKSHLDGPADLCIEIISPESQARDRGEKFYEYDRGGVSEYWLIDAERKKAEFYQLARNRIYRQVLPDSDGIYRSEAIKGLWIKVSWLWQKPLPPILSVLKT